MKNRWFATKFEGVSRFCRKIRDES